MRRYPLALLRRMIGKQATNVFPGALHAVM